VAICQQFLLTLSRLELHEYSTYPYPHKELWILLKYGPDALKQHRNVPRYY
jgi:hypothetical protein